MTLATEWWEWVFFGMPWQVAAGVAVVGAAVMAASSTGDK